MYTKITLPYINYTLCMYSVWDSHYWGRVSTYNKNKRGIWFHLFAHTTYETFYDKVNHDNRVLVIIIYAIITHMRASRTSMEKVHVLSLSNFIMSILYACAIYNINQSKTKLTILKLNDEQ